jgi:hypothetical protein
MPLRELVMERSAVTDLSPLEGLKLDTLIFEPKLIVKGLEIIRRMTTLKGLGPDELHPLPPAEFWQKYDAGEFK